MAIRYFSLAIVLALAIGESQTFAQRGGGGSSAFGTTTNRQSGLGSLTSTPSPSGNTRRGSGLQSNTSLLGAGPQALPVQDDGFVGRDASNVRETFRNLNGRQRRRAMFDIIVGNLNEMRESRKRWHEKQNRTPPVHVQLRPTFDYPSRPAAVIEAGVQSRLTEVMRRRNVATPQVALAGRTATLRGTIGSEHEKALVGKLVSFEPGVSHVENLLVVEGAGTQ